MTDAVDPSRCPLCGSDNRCAVAKLPAAATPTRRDAACAGCWCRRITIATEALQRIPESARQRACLCSGCATPGEPP